MPHVNMPKFKLLIQILACSCETSMSHSNSDTRFSKCGENFSSNPVHGYRFQ